MDYVTKFQEDNHQLKFQMEFSSPGPSNATEGKRALSASGFLLKADTWATLGDPAQP